MDARVPFDFDLNIPYTEDMDSNVETKKDDENEAPPLVPNNTQGAQDVIVTGDQDNVMETGEDNGMEAGEDNGNNQVHATEASASVVNSVISNDDEEDGEEEDVKQPLPFIDLLHVDGYQGATMTGRRRYRRSGRACPIDNTRICTNIHCKSRSTPMWRTGPLGSQTLCNACGIYYRKQMRSAESGAGTGRITFTVIYEDYEE